MVPRAFSTFAKQQRPQQSHKLSHSDLLISLNFFVVQNGALVVLSIFEILSSQKADDIDFNGSKVSLLQWRGKFLSQPQLELRKLLFWASHKFSIKKWPLGYLARHA
jgi:hypothetical protein